MEQEGENTDDAHRLLAQLQRSLEERISFARRLDGTEAAGDDQREDALRWPTSTPQSVMIGQLITACPATDKSTTSSMPDPGATPLIDRPALSADLVG